MAGLRAGAIGSGLGACWSGALLGRARPAVRSPLCADAPRDALAEAELRWLPFLWRVTSVDGIITLADDGLWVFFDLDYEIRGGEWRCDLHPRASNDGRLVVIDSPHAGGGR